MTYLHKGKMAPSQTTLQLRLREENHDNVSQCKLLADNATTRNVVDLLLVIIIFVLLGVAAPIIRGDVCGKFSSMNSWSQVRKNHCR